MCHLDQTKGLWYISFWYILVGVLVLLLVFVFILVTGQTEVNFRVGLDFWNWNGVWQKCIKDNQTEVCLALLNASLFPTRTQFHMTDRIAVNKLHSLTSGEAFIESYLELQNHSKITQNINNDQIGSHYAACLLPQYVDVFFTCECCVCQKNKHVLCIAP